MAAKGRGRTAKPVTDDAAVDSGTVHMDEVHDDGVEQDDGSDVVAETARVPAWSISDQRFEGLVIGHSFGVSGHFLRRFVAVHDRTPAAEQHVVFGGYTFEVVERNDILDTFALKAIREHMG